MSLSAIDILVFVAFYGLVLAVSLWKSRGSKTSEDYFLGGRQLPWWLIGVSIVAANISTEKFEDVSADCLATPFQGEA